MVGGGAELESFGRAGVDRFGVAVSHLGPHEEGFFGAVGRFVLLTSLLEERLRVLHVVLGCGQCTRLDSLHGVIAACQQHVDLLPSERDRADLADVVRRAGRVRMARNHAAHYVFPAQADGTAFGWSEQRGNVRTTDEVSAGTDAEAGQRGDVAAWVDRVRDLSVSLERVNALTWRLPAATFDG